jgi:hypothetical protein
MQRSPSRFSAVCVFALVCVSLEALAAPGSRPKATTADMTSEEVEARARFDQGLSHFDKQEYREALEQFRKSIEKKKTRNAMGYVASCLKQLGQYDDALDQYEQMRRDYPSLPAATEAKVVADMAELAGLVGSLVVTGDTPAGASLFIDDRLRGKLPLDKPLRVSAGRRAVRVEREGFEPITATVDVKAGKENEAQLAARARKGRLVVTEKHNWALRVEVDGADVGVTPYRGLVDVGEHQVRLRGYMSAEALSACDAPAAAATEGAKVASGVEAAVVRLYEETPVVLGAEEQDASLRVASTPPGAQVVIDRNAVGKAPWDGRLPLGEHEIEVRASGFVSARQTVRLERRKQREISVALKREPDREAELRAARNTRVGVGTGLAYGAGAVGFGVFAVAGGLALEKAKELKARCGARCPSTETANLSSASTLGTVSTVGLVAAGVGAVAGTIVLLLPRLGGRRRPAGPSVGVGVRLGSFEIQGRF